MPKTSKRCRGDRKDAKRLRNLDELHVIMPYILPNRTDNEAVFKDGFIIDEALDYLKKKNANVEEGGFKFTIFHFIIAAFAKAIYLHPKLNYFVAGHRMYERNELSFSFVIKKKFEESSEEALAKIIIERDVKTSLIDQVYESIKKQVYSVRKTHKTDETTKKMGWYAKLPRCILRPVVGFVRWMDYHGILPASFIKDDPYYSTVFLSNLGSIKMDADYHHLVNYGTNSFFAIVGEMKKIPVFSENGSFEMKNVVNVSFTIDERIADGFYFANAVKTLRKIIKNPQCLDDILESELERT